jgi:hypothetical protein
LRLIVDKSNILQECLIYLEIIQEYNTGGRGEKIALGNITLNLAEYVEEDVGREGGVVRRYLMQESKINSTLKVGIYMKQTEGDHNFEAPPLSKAPVFGGIGSIMTGEQVESDIGSKVSAVPFQDSTNF